MANEIVTEIRLELDKFRADLKASEKAASESGAKAGKGVGEGVEEGLGRAFGGLKAKLIGLAGALASAFTLKESIAAAIEQEDAINSLNSAMAITGTYSDAASRNFQDLAASLQLTTTSADETITKGGALLATLGQLSGDTLNRATAASLDFAAALGVDVDTAFNLVSKAATGNVGALRRYGIEIQKTGNDAHDFANALAILEDRFSGFAKLQTNTFSGAMAVTKNQFGEVLESLGNIVIKSPTMIALLKLMADTFGSLAAAIAEFAKGRDLIGEFSAAFVTFGSALITYVVAPLELVYNVGVAAFNGLKTVVQGFIVAIAESVSLLTGFLAPLSAKFAEIDAAVKTFAASSGGVLSSFADQTSLAAGKVFEFDAALKAEEYLARMGEFVAAVEPVATANFAALSNANAQAALTPMQELWASMKGGFSDAYASIQITSETFRKNLTGALLNAVTTFGNGVTNSFAAIGGALVKGEGALDAFGKSMLGVFGDLAIQLGSFFVAQGIAMLFSPGLQAAGAGSIAAGLALAVVGGALKALSGGGGGAASASAATSSGKGSGGGVIASDAGVSPEIDRGQDFAEQREADAGARVQVNVQGNILDRKQTGLELAEVINEAFGSNGVAYNS